MSKIIQLAVPTALAAGLCVWDLSAQELTKEETSRLENYETLVGSADPAGAAGFLKDAALLDKLVISTPGKAADLIAKAGAVTEYEKLLDKNWPASQERNLSSAMASRLTEQSPLSKVGLAPEPERTLDWAAKYKKYGVGKTALLKKSLRNWDALFHGFTFTREFDMRGNIIWTVRNSSGVFFMDITGSDAIFKDSQSGMKALWEMMTLKERNSYMSLKAGQLLNSFVEKSTHTDSVYAGFFGGNGLYNYLDAQGLARLEKHIAGMNALELAVPKLNTAQLAELKYQPIEQQLYLLGNIFDRSRITGSAPVERKVDSLRQSKPGETLSPESNRLLAKMLGPAMFAEVKGTVAGDKLAEFYASGARLNVGIESCQGCYAKYEPSSGRMIFDSELIQQYMRVNNVNAETMVRSGEQLAALGKYLSPMLVHEGAHQMQRAWSDDVRVYKPYTQEDEVDSNSLEALYTMEKLDNDPNFKSMMIKMRAASGSYAAKRLELARTFKKNTDDFGDRVRQVYYPGLPSFVAASSQILSAVSGELERRNTLSPAELSEIEATGMGLFEARALSAQELSGSAANIKTGALKKIQDDLLDKSLYEDYYRNAGDWTGSMRQVVKTKAAAPRSAGRAL